MGEEQSDRGDERTAQPWVCEAAKGLSSLANSEASMGAQVRADSRR